MGFRNYPADTATTADYQNTESELFRVINTVKEIAEQALAGHTHHVQSQPFDPSVLWVRSTLLEATIVTGLQEGWGEGYSAEVFTGYATSDMQPYIEIRVLRNLAEGQKELLNRFWLAAADHLPQMVANGCYIWTGYVLSQVIDRHLQSVDQETIRHAAPSWQNANLDRPFAEFLIPFKVPTTPQTHQSIEWTKHNGETYYRVTIHDGRTTHLRFYKAISQESPEIIASALPTLLDGAAIDRLPDVELRSVAEPAFLMSAKAVREIIGGPVEACHYQAIIDWGTANGWKEVRRLGRQLLFVAVLRLQ